MKKLTNHTIGPRGINLKNGTTVWIDPGESMELDAKDIVGELPDLGKPSDTSEVDVDQADALKAATDDLKAANAKVAELEKQVAEQAKQIEELTKPAK